MRGRRPGTTLKATFQGRNYRLYLPPNHRPRTLRPLILMLHGCTQNPDDFAAGTRMDELAEAHAWMVLYPEQPAGANRQRCWNWFRTDNQRRGRGEPAELVALVEQIAQEYGGDRARIYVAGLSAGACTAVALGVLYPDLFAAVGAVAAVPYGAAGTPLGAITAMRSGAAPSRVRAASLAARTIDRPPVPLVLFHGLEDAVVVPENSTLLLQQWAEIHGLGPAGLGAGGGRTLRRPAGQHPVQEERYQDRRGAELVRRYLVHRMGHSWPGGAPGASYTDPAGPSASQLIFDFFRRTPARMSAARQRP